MLLSLHYLNSGTWTKLVSVSFTEYFGTKRLLQKSNRKTWPKYVSCYWVLFWFIPAGYIFMLKILGMKCSTTWSTRLFQWPNRMDCLYLLSPCILVTGKLIPFLDIRSYLRVRTVFSTSLCRGLSYGAWHRAGSQGLLVRWRGSCLPWLLLITKNP